MRLRLPSPGREKFGSVLLGLFVTGLNEFRLRGLLGPNIVTEGVLHVYESSVATLGDLVDGLEVCIGELDALEVAVDS